ncbi:hypothetical protein [Ectobacillus funiculus]|uniref:hypothetical protein n=1 Tax=Ectobacillus funiculus TaxID=137993 RepID=UPI00101D21CD|nr:hypothetical protein [Ectobacillus funiculus]
MKKKWYTLMISYLLCTSIIAGCSKDTAATGGNGGQQAAAAQGAFERPDLSGEITEVNGNEVTLKIIEQPQRNNGNGRNPQGNNQEKQGDQDNNQGNPGGTGGMRPEISYTGEVKTITIPADASLVAMTRGANGMSETAVNMSELTAGVRLSIYYKEDGKTISKVSVQKQMAEGGNTSN